MKLSPTLKAMKYSRATSHMRIGHSTHVRGIDSIQNVGDTLGSHTDNHLIRLQCTTMPSYEIHLLHNVTKYSDQNRNNYSRPQATTRTITFVSRRNFYGCTTWKHIVFTVFVYTPYSFTITSLSTLV